MTAADGGAPPGPGVALVEVTNQTLVAVLPLLPGALLLSAPDGCLLLSPTRPSRCLVCMPVITILQPGLPSMILTLPRMKVGVVTHASGCPRALRAWCTH